MALACIGSLEHLRYVPQENGQLVAGWGCSEGYEWIGQEPAKPSRLSGRYRNDYCFCIFQAYSEQLHRNNHTLDFPKR